MDEKETVKLEINSTNYKANNKSSKDLLACLWVNILTVLTFPMFLIELVSTFWLNCIFHIQYIGEAIFIWGASNIIWAIFGVSSKLITRISIIIILFVVILFRVIGPIMSILILGISFLALSASNPVFAIWGGAIIIASLIIFKVFNLTANTYYSIMEEMDESYKTIKNGLKPLCFIYLIGKGIRITLDGISKFAATKLGHYTILIASIAVFITYINNATIDVFDMSLINYYELMPKNVKYTAIVTFISYLVIIWDLTRVLHVTLISYSEIDRKSEKNRAAKYKIKNFFNNLLSKKDPYSLL